jgi:hypothetical protein
MTKKYFSKPRMGYDATQNAQQAAARARAAKAADAAAGRQPIVNPIAKPTTYFPKPVDAAARARQASQAAMYAAQSAQKSKSSGKKSRTFADMIGDAIHGFVEGVKKVVNKIF